MSQIPLCPYCGATEYRRISEWRLVCNRCGHEFDVRRDVCPVCGVLNRDDVLACYKCSTRLRRDSVEYLIEVRARPPDWWREERAVMAAIHKRREEEASRRRMEAYWAEEQARREALARAQAKVREQERRMLLIAAGVSGGIILLVVAITIIMALSR